MAAIVIDNGSGSIKAGISGDDAPRVVFPNVAGRLRIDTLVGEKDRKECYVGAEAIEKRGILSIRTPIERGIVTSWDDMEKVWHHTFYNELRETPSEHPCFLTDALLSPEANREKMTQIMFETFEVPAFHVCPQTKSALYFSGRETGTVLESGEGVTQVSSFIEGHILPASILKADFAGHELTEHLVKIARERGVDLTGSDNKRILTDIKKELCFVAQDFQAELAHANMSKVYELPDGQTISLANERIRCPEALFYPRLAGKELDGIQEMVLRSIAACEPSVQANLYANIILSGGSTMFPGIAERMTKEISARLPSNIRVKVAAPPERINLAWIGGSILSSLSSFQEKWITKADYQEVGPSIVHQKCN